MCSGESIVYCDFEYVKLACGVFACENVFVFACGVLTCVNVFDCGVFA